MSGSKCVQVILYVSVHCGGPGQSSAIDVWTLADIAPCPNCGGHLLWAENGNVPGYRICRLCGRSWMVKGTHDEAANTVSVHFDIPDTDRGPEWAYGQPDTSDKAYQYFLDRMEMHGGGSGGFGPEPTDRRTWEHYQR